MTRPTQTLLLIEDSAPNRELYRCCLMLGAEPTYCVLEAESIVAGLALCRTQAIDAILLDYVLPDGTGLEFLQALHAQSNGSSPPVVMVTGKGDERVAVQAIKLGAEDYLVKRDLTPELLQVTMRSAIENARLRRQLRQSDDRFRVSIENMLDYFGIYSAIRDQSGQIVDFRFDYLNAAALESNGMTQADLSKTLCEVFPAHHESGLFADYCRVVETGEPLVKESLIYSDTFGVQHLTRAYDIRVSQLGDGIVISWRDVTERKQTEIALQAANQQITTIWESMTDAYVTLDRDWRIVYANPAATQVICQLTDLEPEAFLGRTHWEAFPWSIGQIPEREYRRAVAEQVAVHFEMFYEPSGDWFEVHAYPSPAGLGIYFREISDRKRSEAAQKQAEAALQESERRLREIFNTTFQFVGLLSPEGILLEANQTALDFGGITREEAVGRPFWEVRWWTISPQTQQQLRDAIAQAAQGEFVRYEAEVLGAGETTTTIDFSLKPVRDEFGEVVLLIPEGRDISDRLRNEGDRKQIETALQESETRYRMLTELVPQILWTARPDGYLDYFNQQWAEFAGVDPAETEGWNWQPILHPEDQQKTVDLWTQATQTGQPYECEHRVRRANGEYRWLLSRALPLRDETGEITKWFGTATDIHATKQLEIERTQLLAASEASRAEAEAANRSKDEFVAIVAHELRSPLNSIAGWSKLLQTRKFDEATLSKALDTIWRNTQTQVQLVEDLLDISRMVRGTLQINFAPVNWVNVIEAALDIVRPMAEDKQIQLEAHLSLTPQISGDFNRLQQIAVNLLTNAVKFTPPGGRVEVHLEQADAQVVLQVRDTGKGIAPEFLPHIFERYQQGQKNAGAKDGLGLGLAIVKNLVELHGGTIMAESAGIGAGTTFTVRLPRLETPALQQAPFGVDAPSLAGIRVLAVDDDPDMLNLIAFVLRDVGAEVQAVTSAAAALECLSQLSSFRLFFVSSHIIFRL